MNFTVYIIQGIETKKFYIGHTSNLVRRLKQHHRGKTKSLKNKGPFEVVYTETLTTKQLAYKREREIKSYKGGIQFKNLLK